MVTLLLLLQLAHAMNEADLKSLCSGALARYESASRNEWGYHELSKPDRIASLDQLDDSLTAWIERIRSTDGDEALANKMEFVLHAYPFVRSTLARANVSDEIRHDVAIDTLLRVAEKANLIDLKRAGRKVLPYLTTSAHHCLVEFFRKQGRQITMVTGAGGEGEPENVTLRNLADRPTEKTNSVQELHNLMNELPADQKQLAQLMLDDLTLVQLSERMNLSVGQVRALQKKMYATMRRLAGVEDIPPK